MPYLWLQQSRTANISHEQLIEKKPLWRICRFRDLGESSVGQNTESMCYNSVGQHSNMLAQGENLGQRDPRQKPASDASCSRSQLSVGSKEKTVSKEQFTDRELEPTFPRFGPSYGKDVEAIKAAKEEAWKHVLDTAPDQGLKKSEFRLMMIEDGCFFLQLALCILGGSKQLGYPESHVYFKETPNYKQVSSWIKAMFFVGNQIPCVVIRELMKQSFFQNVIRKGIEKKIWNLPLDLPKMVLYLLVVSPELERNSPITSWPLATLSWRREKQAHFFQGPPSNILHGLHCLVLGSGNDPLDCENEDGFDLEACTEDLDRNNRFPSATEVKQTGITLKKAKQGIREIQFSKWLWLFAYLYVPTFTFDGDTETMLRYLKSYEIEQQLGRNKREVTSYLLFMRDFIQTQRDVNLLQSKGIIDIREQNHKDKLHGILNRLVSSEDVTFTQNLRMTRLQVLDYSRPPWHLLSLALFLTVVQTIFTILSYVKPRN